MVGQAFSADVVTNPIKLDKVLRAAGQSLIFNGRGNSVVDFGIALKDIRPNTIEMIKLPGGGVGERQEVPGRAVPAGGFRTSSPPCSNEQLDPFLLEHPEFRQQDQVAGRGVAPHPRWGARRASG